MQDDPKAHDPLLRAISDLRDHLDRLIDEQRSILVGSESEGPISVGGPVVRADTGAEPAALYIPAAEFTPKPRKMTAIAVYERTPEPARPDPAPAAEPAPEGRVSDDPRLRLDALAKHLDRKMRQAGAPTADPSGRSSG